MARQFCRGWGDELASPRASLIVVPVGDPFIPSLLLLTLSKLSSLHYEPTYYHSMIAEDNHFDGSVAALGGFAFGYTENGQSAYTYSAVPEITTVNQVGSFFRQ